MMPEFPSCGGDSRIHARPGGTLPQKDGQWAMVHGVLIRISHLGVLIMGESGIGKTAAGLALISSGNRWVADDAVLLGCKGSALYGRGHERTREWIAVRGRGILRAEELLDAKHLLGETRVDVIIRLIRVSEGNSDRWRDSHFEFARVSIPRRDIAADIDPRRTAERLMECIRDLLTA